ncbi:MAG TPA: pilus assembly protein TadG-related protein [Pirellulaceae bacterium]|nr:pilus assembly protein TadG-related protein [Pirellulaceae bacterium]
MKHRSRDRRGVIVVLVALCLVAILGVTAIAIDGGMLMEQRRSVQAGADAAALAAAEQLYEGWSTNQGQDNDGKASDTAFLTASANGFTNDGTTSVVTVNIPPATGDHVGQAGFAEVKITYYQKRGFSAIFGSSKLPVNGRAVAKGKKGGSNIGVLLLSPSAQGALTITGSAAIQVDGRVVVNSTHTKAAISSGSASLNSSQMDIGGGYSSSSTSYFHADPGSVQTGQSAVSDFLADVPVPDKSGMSVRSSSIYSATSGETLQPGLYIGGIKINSQPNVTFAPGIYYLEGGGLTMSGGAASLTALEVMIYNGSNSSGSTGKITLSGGGAVKMSPPAGGDYAGMAIFQDRTATSVMTLSGGSTWDFKGTIYAAKAAVTVSGGSGASMGSQYISDTLTLSGSSAFQDINPDDGFGPRDIKLVE